jgi:WD40 repeat protein
VSGRPWRWSLGCAAALVVTACERAAPAPAAASASVLKAEAEEAAEVALAASPGGSADAAATQAPWTLPRGESPTVRAFFVRVDADPSRRPEDESEGFHRRGDEALLITADAAGTLQIWPAWGRNEAITLAGHVARVERVAASADARVLVSSAADQTLRLWFLEDNLAIGGEDKSGEPRRPPLPGAFNPPVALEGAEGQITALAVDPRGRQVAAGSALGGVYLWATEAPTSVAVRLAHPAAVVALRFDMAGERLLALPAAGAPRIWSSADGWGAATLVGADEAARAYVFGAFSRDAEAIALLRTSGAVELWRGDGAEQLSVAEPTSAAPIETAGSVFGAFGAAPPGASAGQIWPAEAERRRFGWPASGQVLVVSDGAANVVKRTGTSRPLRVAGPVIDAVFSADGGLLAIVEEGGRARLWRLRAVDRAAP